MDSTFSDTFVHKTLIIILIIITIIIAMAAPTAAIMDRTTIQIMPITTMTMLEQQVTVTDLMDRQAIILVRIFFIIF